MIYAKEKGEVLIIYSAHLMINWYLLGD
jgi:hypothetical protein